MSLELAQTALAPPSDRSQALADWLRDYARRRIHSRLIDERRCIPPHVALDFGNRGLLGMQVPAGQGGLLGLDHQEYFWLLRQLGAIDFTLAAFVGLNNCLGVRPILRFGNPAMRERYLPDLARGRILGAFAVTEAGAGSNPAGIAAVAQRQANGFVLSGEKWWSGSAQWAGVINVVARHHDTAGRHCGFVALCVDGDQPGLRQGEEALTLGLRGMVQNQLHFDAAAIGADRVLGSPYAGMSVAADTMGYGRLAIAAVAGGAVWRLLQLMVRYTSRRRVGETLLYGNDHVQAVILEHWRAASALDLLVRRIGIALDGGASLPPEVHAAAKLVATELLWAAADAAMQLLGGRAYCENNPVAQIWRDARITRVFEGPSETIASYLGQQLLREPSALLQHLQTRHAGQAAQLQAIADCCRAQDAEPSARGLVALGEAAAWTVLAAYVEPAPELAGWLGAKRAAAAERLLAPAEAALPDADLLAALIDRQAGLVRQMRAGEQRELDPYLFD
ncbi:acyl-CoA dehydrogenase family protein [Chitinimonas koreensis]|uniref:acyl-CoA dehydrogenase family protein n=1 Tax=Chitinimonas koreensis TaxID=356302 RepID=UPI00042700C5|nr:acyl-CoA dehydrogenase family protein [Chitinimonas koreensis]QNM98207.1 acyl-CoA dehydrogenase family protein [Chitinimonas koreensis]